tara:strand:- start:227 stop:565 length:339 start_codon:yes stop_codon:yes gene_type:complete
MIIYTIREILGQKSFFENKKIPARRVHFKKVLYTNAYLTVPRQNRLLFNKDAICATVCHQKSTLWHSYYSLIPTLLSQKHPLCHCATDFFLMEKKTYAPNISLMVAQLQKPA